MNKKTIRDIDLKNKKVLVRCDFNVPLDPDLNIIDNILNNSKNLRLEVFNKYNSISEKNDKIKLNVFYRL